ncbi:VAMP-associated [Pyrrhoderma noxium]|uniref:VAMP-associated n=1 Tax=Pyrrhoderma noxium TaxID=2282107 RepID=A0A286UC34_9AGAM|nr:VAMP-associated [Pyrrhoderma noxium]
MSVSLKPSASLGFNRPLTQVVKRALTITNNNEQPVAFKVKTTAPKLYCVRPNSGRIDPGDSVDVQVLLQAMKEEPPLNAKCKDKFLIQSTLITPEKESLPLADLWGNVDGEEPKVHQQKIKVIYLPPIGHELPEEDENPNGMADSLKNLSARHELDVSGNGRHELNIPHEPQAPLERAFSPAVGDYEAAQDIDVVEIPASAPIRVVPASTPFVPIPIEEHKPALAASQAEISRLRKLLESIPEPPAGGGVALGESESHLTRRRRSDKSDTLTMVSERTDMTRSDFGTYVGSASSQAEGIPPQVVGIICIVVFTLTYVFF